MHARQSDGEGLRLNVGAGDTGWGDVWFDIDRTEEVNVVGDMHALPFGRDSFSEVLVDNVIEHSPDTTGVLREIHRVLRPGGIVYIYVPYYTAHGAYADPTHRTFFSEDTFDYYTVESDYDHYADFEFDLVLQEFFYSKLLRLLPSERLKLKLGHMIGDLVLAMKMVLRKPGTNPVEPTIEGWLES